MKSLILGLCAAVLLWGCGAAAVSETTTPSTDTAAAPTQLGTLQLTDVWARPVMTQPTTMTTAVTATSAMTNTQAGGMLSGGLNSAAYLVINNTGAEDRLIQATSTVARVVELHTVEETNGVKAMRQVEAIVVPANGTATLKPGGFHIMLIDVQQDLKPDDTFTITLTFEKAGAITVPVTVRNPVMP